MYNRIPRTKNVRRFWKSRVKRPQQRHFKDITVRTKQNKNYPA